MLLGGKPLIAYCLEALHGVAEIDDVYVYCSSEIICNYLPAYVEYMKRPEYLDASDMNWTQIFGMFKKTVDADIYISAHATAPFVTSETIKNGLNVVMTGQHDSAFCAMRYNDYFWRDGKPLNFDPANITRSQDLPTISAKKRNQFIRADSRKG